MIKKVAHFKGDRAFWGENSRRRAIAAVDVAGGWGITDRDRLPEIWVGSASALFGIAWVSLGMEKLLSLAS